LDKIIIQKTTPEQFETEEEEEYYSRIPFSSSTVSQSASRHVVQHDEATRASVCGKVNIREVGVWGKGRAADRQVS
jgi:hypothetical protein